ncbi:hypothetical protein [Varibaculum vaginae]|uniref:hypothetical protein n=1 Tax=Varibaculum vaginae TaxID=2364797 RepID=UPI00135A719D|nr:hypothetical protein [Varibaculum vaginae]
MKKTQKLATAVAAFALSFAMVPSAIAAPAGYGNPTRRTTRILLAVAMGVSQRREM